MDNKELIRIVGSENFLDNIESLQEYSKDMSFVNPIRPWCVVKPRNVDEVQAITKWANETLTPIVPVSSGLPRFRGDTIPSVGGVVIMDLSQMKRIIRVDRRNRVAMIEPGVTFGELNPELGKEDLAPFMPFLPRSTKSVLSSSLEREPITIPRLHWDSQDPLLCLEVILGTGDLFRTGSAAGPGTIEEQWAVGRAQMRPMGPSQMDPARYIQGSQGTMGIVTWITLKCKILPKIKKAFFVPAGNIEDLIDCTYKILWKRLGDECFILNAHNLACILGESGDDLKTLIDELPPWILFWSTEGVGLFPQEKVDYQEAELKDVAKSFGLTPVPSVAEIGAVYVSELLSKPSREPYWKLRSIGGCHDIFFITTMDKTPAFIQKVYELAISQKYPTDDIGVYLQPTVQGTNCHCEFNLFYDPQNPSQVEKVKKLDAEGSKVLANMGGFFSRPYGMWSNIAYGPSAYTVIAQRMVKDVYDPNGIMNPGKLCF